MTRRRWILAIVALVLVLGAGVAVAGYVVWQNRHPGTIRGSSTVEFETTEEPGATTRPEEVVRKVPWPTYGYDEQRTRYAPGFDLRPPFTTTWDKGTGSLLEFPPVVAYGRVYVGTNDGRFLAVNAETGRIVWQKNFSRCIAASPTMGEDVIYQPLMDPFPCREHKQDAAGYVVAIDPDTGRELWRFEAGVVETSPLVVGNLLYFGSWDKKMYAVDVNTHKAVWTFPTGDQVKAGPAYAAARSSSRPMTTRSTPSTRAPGSSAGRRAGPRTSTPRRRSPTGVCSSGTRTGASTPSARTAATSSGRRQPGASSTPRPRSGRRRSTSAPTASASMPSTQGPATCKWSFDAGGEISGAPTVLDGVVYFSTLEEKTFGLDAQTGKKLWEFDDGKYSPVVADKERVYLAGYKRLYALTPSG